MMSNNKVLTVSYGTFSCTLEGFEDSFGTMKVIAEYFRDLAADDRYFGAVPPQPDAEMLARIAEREVSRRVEAHSEEGRIVLKTDAPADASVAPDTPAIPAAAPVAAAVAAESVAPEATPEPVVETAPEAPADVLPDIAVETAPGVPTDTAEITETEDAAVDDIIANVAEATAEPEPVLETTAPVAEEPVEPTVEAEIVEEVAAEDKGAKTIADKLERIRAVVAQDDDEDDDFSEDEHAEDVLRQTREDIESALETDTAEEGNAGSDSLDSALASVLDARADSLAEAEISGEDTVDADKLLLSGLDPAPEAEQAKDDNLFEGKETKSKSRRRARVLKVKRTDVAAAIDANDTDGPADLSQLIQEGAVEEVAVEEPEVESTLSADAEADLLRELALVESELGDDAADVRQDANPADIEDADVDRLMDTAEQHMDEPEGSQSRDTFRQLRAAVAARNADDDLKNASDGEGDENAYRSDLAEVVRPRRPASGNGSDRRPGRPAAAPLKLVAEQRVDVEQPAPAASSGNIVPRRVSADQAASVDVDGGFAEFASDMGASTLPDLLEAAAAYMAFVEGKDDFSRPQLMQKVRQLDPEDFRREDGLRSFGQLLREGKIEKLRGGRFAATSDIGFQPRKAAG